MRGRQGGVGEAQGRQDIWVHAQASFFPSPQSQICHLRIHPPRFRDCWLLRRMHLDLPSRGYMRIKEHYSEAGRYIRSTPQARAGTNTQMIFAAARKDTVRARALSQLPVKNNTLLERS